MKIWQVLLLLAVLIMFGALALSLYFIVTGPRM